MAFKKAGNSFSETVDITEKEGKTFLGHFIRTKIVESDKITGGTALFHEFMLPETNEIVGMWGKGQLNKKLEEVAGLGVSALTKITYLGTDTYKKGKKTLEAHQFDVEYDADSVVSR